MGGRARAGRLDGLRGCMAGWTRLARHDGAWRAHTQGPTHRAHAQGPRTGVRDQASKVGTTAAPSFLRDGVLSRTYGAERNKTSRTEAPNIYPLASSSAHHTLSRVWPYATRSDPFAVFTATSVFCMPPGFGTVAATGWLRGAGAAWGRWVKAKNKANQPSTTQHIAAKQKTCLGIARERWTAHLRLAPTGVTSRCLPEWPPHHSTGLLPSTAALVVRGARSVPRSEPSHVKKPMHGFSPAFSPTLRVGWPP